VGFGHSIRGVANWILDEADRRRFPVSNMALNKLAYFLYEAYLLSFGTILTRAKIEAWEHGPVFREIYQSFKEYGDKPITGRATFFCPNSEKLERAVAAIPYEDEQFFRETLQSLLPLSASRLRALSHVEGGPWWCVWWYDGEVNPGMEITPEVILARSKGAL
jgi:uncharacterized phage-associated protein